MQIKKEKVIRICDKVIEFCIYGFAFFLPISNALIEVCVGWSIFALLVKKIIQKKFPKTPLNIFIGIYFLSLLVSAIFSSHIDRSLYTIFAKILHYVAFYFAVAEVTVNKRILRNTIIVLSFSLLLVCIDGIQQYFTHFDFIRHREWPWDMHDARIIACFTTPNSLSAYLSVISMIIISSFIYFKGLYKKIYFIILSLLTLSCLFLSLTRSALIAFILALIFFLILKKDKKLALIISLVFVSCSGIFYLLNSLSILNNLFSFRVINIVKIFYIGGGERRALWQMGWHMFKDSPIWGQGIGTFMQNFSKYAPCPAPQLVSYAHNSYLQLLAEAGILGLFSFCAIIIATLYRAIKKYLQTKENDWSIIHLGFISSLLVLLIHAFFDNHFYSLTFSLLFWFLVGVNVSLCKE